MTTKAIPPLTYGALGAASRVHVLSDGIHVTDEANTERIHLGQLADEVYGLLIRNGRLGAGTNTTIDDFGLKVTDGAAVERVRVGNIGGSDYGLKVTNAGSVVIIDGTSDMFRIAATGTISLTTADNTVADSTSVTLPGLGALSSTPAHQSFISNVNTVDGVQLNPLFLDPAAPAWVAGVSGGATTNRAEVFNVYARIATNLNGSNQCVVSLRQTVLNRGASFTGYGRYYVLQQVAL